jgi:hypothetical protein
MAPVAPVLVQAPPAAATGDYVTVTRGELDALLAERTAHAKAEAVPTDN